MSLTERGASGRGVGPAYTSTSFSVPLPLQVAMAPQLRGLLRRKLAREILTAVGLGLAMGGVYWYSVVLPRRRRYEDFYRNYDAKAVAESMTASFEEGGH